MSAATQRKILGVLLGAPKGLKVSQVAARLGMDPRNVANQCSAMKRQATLRDRQGVGYQAAVEILPSDRDEVRELFAAYGQDRLRALLDEFERGAK